MPVQKHGPAYLIALRREHGLSLRRAAAELEVSPQALRRYETGERTPPPRVWQAAERLAAMPTAVDRVRVAAARRPARSAAQLRRALPIALRPILDRLLASGELELYPIGVSTTGSVIRRSERLVIRAVGDRPRGLERTAPVIITGRALRAARLGCGARVEELARCAAVRPVTWRSWEAQGVPRARVESVAQCFAAPSGQEIQRRREEAGWSRDELGRRVGVSGVYVGAIEAGDRPMPPGRVVALLVALSEADESAQARFEEGVRNVVDRVRREPGVSRATLIHEHTWEAAGHRVTSPLFLAELRAAEQRRLIEEGVVARRSGPERQGLFLRGAAPPKVRAMTGVELARERERLHVTKAELGELCGVAPATIAKWEARERLLDRAALRARAGLEKARAEDRAGGRARSQVLNAVTAAPGISTTALKRAAGEWAVGRALDELLRTGHVAPADAYDSVGRRYDGWYRADMVPVDLLPMSGNELTERRRAAGWTQPALARALGVGPRTVWSWEVGRVPIPRPRVPRIEELLSQPAPAGHLLLSGEDRAHAEEVRAIRRGLGLSQSQLGRELAVATSTVSGWETGHMPVPSLRLEQLRGLDMPLPRAAKLTA